MQPKTRNLITTILWVGFIVGLLDISAAFIQIKIMFPERNPLGVFRYIASAVFGKERANSENSMFVWGALFHFIIAYCFTSAFFLIYPQIPILSKRRFITGIIYGLIIWSIMNLIIVPLTKIGHRQFVLKNAAIAAGILIIAIGLPLSYLTYRFYYGHKNRSQFQPDMAD